MTAGNEWRDAATRRKVAALAYAARDVHPDSLALWTGANWRALAADVFDGVVG